MISTRHAPAVLVLLALTAVPTVIHSYLDSRGSDNRQVKSLPAALAGETGVPTNRRANWGADHLASDDWLERTYPGPAPVKLFVGKSYDLKKLYHHPELAVDYSRSYEGHAVVRLPQRPDVPVHLLRGGHGERRRLAMYVLEYDGTYVANPIGFQLRTSLELLFSKRKPMTLLFASQDTRGDGEPETTRAAEILIAAVGAIEALGRP